MEIIVGASLLAKASGQSPSKLTVMPSSRAGSLPQSEIFRDSSGAKSKSLAGISLEKSELSFCP
ncbi:hypothetical protein E5170_03880 [Pseudomonas atacamensis]|uniref:Uncharacterized protein n=1 Tax=Pseudomonas atacamensis TaxID=2565368 RepID=A0AAQ2DHR8_9PSED|nr:hypothetical protein E5170_03880 [Pseudomonas atacamensis]TSB50735.1 hypothetical protein FEE99_17945 [Pseudomonas sp. ef1]